jgi:carbamoyltransferase
MLLVAPVKEDKLSDAGRRALRGDRDEKGLDRLKELRSTVPAVTHVDNSARVQTIDERRAPRFYKILKAFKARTGSPVVINTSFNVRGEPIVCTPRDAYRCFMNTNMDVLVLENHVLLKADQPQAREIDREAYLAEFALD